MINIGAACAQLGVNLQYVQRRFYALAPELADDRIRKDIALMVRMYGDDLHDPLAAPDSARRVYFALWGEEVAPKEWWRSPLGMSVAHWIGYYRPEVPYMMASKILNVSRQRIYQLIHDEEKLVGVPGAHAVTAASLAAHIQSLG